MYALSWDSENFAVKVTARLDYIASLPALTEVTPLIDLMEPEGSKSFMFTGDKWGYNGALGRTEHDDAAIFTAVIPKHEMQECYICHGDVDQHLELFGYEKCICCEGTGEAAKIPWPEIDLVRHSLAVLFKWLGWIDEEAPEQHPLIKIVMLTGVGNGDIGGALGQQMGLFLHGVMIGREAFLQEKVGTVVRDAYDRMSKLRQFGLDRTWLRICDQRLMVDVPGSASGVYEGGNCAGERRGELFCHNMDGGLQQLSCLAGLAALESLHNKMVVTCKS